MTDLEKPFEDLVLERVEQLQKKVHVIEAEAKLPADAIRNVIRSKKRSGPTLSRAKEICDALGLEFYIGPPRETGTTPHVMIAGDDYATVPYHDVAASAGPGAEADPHATVENYAFRRDWLARQGVAPQNAAMLRVRGDSMAPLIVDGDVLLIDTTRRQPPIRPRGIGEKRRADIYVLTVDGDARIKWVERPEESVMVLYSENFDYPPELFTPADRDRISITGKVIWWGHTVKT